MAAGINTKRGNVKRTMRRHMPCFIRFLQSMVTMQSQARPGPVRFVPFADDRFIPWDAWKISRAIKAVAPPRPSKGPAREQYQLRMFAAAVIATLGWTGDWARAIGFPPVPCNRDYEGRLRRALVHTWRNSLQLMNVRIRACCSRSWIHACSIGIAMRKIDKVIGDVRGILNRVAGAGPAVLHSTVDHALLEVCGHGFPREGYSYKLARGLLPHVGVDLPHGETLPMASGTRAGLAALSGESVEAFSLPAVAKERLTWALGIISEEWPCINPDVPMPEFNIDHVMTMLCVWHAAGQPDSFSPHRHVMSAA